MAESTPDKSVIVIGAGDHARMVASALVASGHVVGGFYADDPAMIGHTILGTPVLGTIAEIDADETRSAVVAIGSNQARKRVSASLNLNWMTVVHPSVIVFPEVFIGPGSVILAGCVLEFGAKVGSHVIVNTMSCLAHHSRVGDYAHVVKANVSSHCVVEEGALIGANATLIPTVRVGAWSTVGAGAVVTGEVASGDTVVGVPARRVPA